MTQICPVHADTVRQVEKQAERTDSLFVDVASAQSGLARVEQKTTELRADHNDLVEKVDIIDERVRNLEKFQAAANMTIQNVTENLQRAHTISKEVADSVVDMDKKISIMAVKVAGIVGGASLVISVILSFLVNYLS
jgi:chromosome segregation ATPase